ncbi:MAG: cell envelope biogenesis protein OmpA, partial [Bacteroides sp.]
MKVKTKAICLLSALLVVGNGVIEAQTSTTSDKYKVETNSFWDNWFIQVGGGGQVYFGDGDSQGSFGKR